jgi:quinol monooxygenase YgiN
MIVSVAVLSVRQGHQDQVLEIIQKHLEREKSAVGCVQAYFKRALDNDDTFLLYVEYDNLEHFRAADRTPPRPEGEKVEFALRPHLLKGFFGNFD